MRIIAGEYGGRVLKSPPGNKTRPTSDKLRETLFNILSGRTEGARFLDLCAGTGAVGIEAISRGADFVTFVDRSRKACALIEENLDLLAVPEEMTEILSITAENFTSKKVEQSYDIIYYDPPYSEDYHYVLSEIGAKDSSLLAENGLLVAEHHTKRHLPETCGQLRRWRTLNHGETSLSFYDRG